jgi:hypothetical protein
MFLKQTYDWIKIDGSLNTALQHLPAEQVLGLGTMVRIPSGLTVMISIAEAVHKLLDVRLSELLWIAMQLIQEAMRAEGRGENLRAMPVSNGSEK